MTLSRDLRMPFAITALLFSTLACRAATRLIIPDTPTPQPTSTSTPTLIPTLTLTLPPTLTPTLEYTASCPLILDTIIADSAGFDENFYRDETTADKEDAYLVH